MNKDELIVKVLSHNLDFEPTGDITGHVRMIQQESDRLQEESPLVFGVNRKAADARAKEIWYKAITDPNADINREFKNSPARLIIQCASIAGVVSEMSIVTEDDLPVLHLGKHEDGAYKITVHTNTDGVDDSTEIKIKTDSQEDTTIFMEFTDTTL